MLRSRLFCYDLNGFKTGNCLMLNAVAPFIGNVQLSNIMLRNQHFALLSSGKSYFRFCSQLGYL